VVAPEVLERPVLLDIPIALDVPDVPALLEVLDALESDSELLLILGWILVSGIVN
jgi:hypothetical protein